MTTLTLLLLRHGQTEHNTGLRLTGWGDPPLDETGRRQAEEAAQELTAKYDIEALYASPLLRAQQTAEALARRTGLTPQLREGLKELYFGEVEGLTLMQVRERHPELFGENRSFDSADFRWPGGESRSEFHTRVDQAVWEIIQAEAGLHSTVAIAAHGGSLGTFAAQVATGELTAWRHFLLKNCQYFEVTVEYDGLPLTRDNARLRLTYSGQLEPVRPNT